MKKTFKILAVIIVVLLLAAFILPFVFKGQIIEKVKQEANNNLNAKIEFSDFGLSLFRNFPDFSLEINDLSVVGVNEFENDTLAYVRSFSVSINFLSVFNGENYEIKSVNIDGAKLLLISLENGKVNWDIAKSDGSEEGEEGSSFKITLKKLKISDAKVIYKDDALATQCYIYGMNHILRGDLTADQTTLKTNTSIDNLTLLYDGVKYLNNANIDFKADFEADLLNSKYTFSKNELRLNNLFLAFNGYLKLLEEDYEMDIDFSASKTDFKNFLSLIPAIYARDFEDIETEGKLTLDGFVKGLYTENSLPAFKLGILVDDAMFKYPDLPGSVDNITINANVSNEGGSADNTQIEIKKMHFEISENPVDITMLIKTPESDPYIDGHLQGEIDLSKIKEVYPLESGEELNGEFIANIYLKGNMSSIENEEYQDFKAIGSLLLQAMSYKSPDFPNGVEIKNAQLNFSPAYIDLVAFNSTIGESDLSASGKIVNYMAYILGDEMIKGTFTTQSKYFNLNDMMPAEEEEISTEDNADTIPLSIIKVPSNVDFFLSSTFDKIIYDEMEMTDVVGAILIKDEKLMLRDLSMKLLDGSMTVNGVYSTVNPDMPEVNFDLNINDFDIQQSFHTFETMEVLAPVAKHASGKFSAKMKYNASLDQEMMPILSTMSGRGDLTTTKLELNNVEALNKLADALKMGKLKNLELEKVNLSFEFKDGKVIVKPYDIKYQNISAVISGTTSFEKDINYSMKLKIPRSEFGAQANDVLNDLLKQVKDKGVDIKPGDVVNVDVTITGTVSKPIIKTGFKDLTSSATEQLKSQLDKEIEARKKEIQNKADEEIEKVKKEAEAKIRKEKEKAAAEAERLKKEAEKKAKKEADKLKKKADEEAKKLLKKLF